jgi:predicted DNA-binding protein
MGVSDADDTDTVPLNVPMPRQLHARMKSKAAITGRTIRRFVIEAVEEKLEREEGADPRKSRRP